jgi:hypothetical protein
MRSNVARGITSQSMRRRPCSGVPQLGLREALPLSVGIF